MDDLDHDRLADLITLRDHASGSPRPGVKSSASAGYFQGRIDEYCAQNAIDQTDTDLPLKLMPR